MCNKNAIWRYLKSANTRTNPTIYSFLLTTVIVSSLALGSLPAILSAHSLGAEMGNTNMAGSMMSSNSNSPTMMKNQSMASNMMSIPAKAPVLNITTAGPPISPTMFKSLTSQMHVDLVNATMIAEKWVGNNSRAVSSMVGIQNGSPVYTIWIIDSNSGLHQIVVDPQNGNVLFANQPMSMTGPFS